ncbi:hypothetical protein B0H13DRAFT_2306814 [Mycena leptocephala]|nr:hypothetical protein B0H13DRAFT_2306814 [Mycena leptocephala]
MQVFVFSTILVVLALGAQGASIPAPTTHGRCASDSQDVSCALFAFFIILAVLAPHRTQVLPKQLMTGSQAIAAVLQTVKMLLARMQVSAFLPFSPCLRSPHRTQVPPKQLMTGSQAIAAVLQTVKMLLARSLLFHHSRRACARRTGHKCPQSS